MDLKALFLATFTTTRWTATSASTAPRSSSPMRTTKPPRTSMDRSSALSLSNGPQVRTSATALRRPASDRLRGGSISLTEDGTVVALPTPGYLSVVVRTGEVTYFLAGDGTFDQDFLLQRVVDSPAGDLPNSLRNMDRIAGVASTDPTVVLPAHEPPPRPGLPSASC
ncbi:MAG: hypothetical protein QM572_00730 [Nocardioides sp.]|uniref:hypothetical protein n=1 Tax=Nocardioides sp. TaxID=35761 RepID=UPI0039E53784